MEPTRAFDSLALPAIQTQPDTSADTKDLVRIEGARAQVAQTTTAWVSAHGVDEEVVGSTFASPGTAS